MERVRVWFCSVCQSAGEVKVKVDDCDVGLLDKDTTFIPEAVRQHKENNPGCRNDPRLMPRWLSKRIVEMAMDAFSKLLENKSCAPDSKEEK